MSYSDKVIDHYNNPRNVGSMDKNSTDVGTGLVGAPECGDVMKLQIKVNRDTNVIEEAKFKTFGCGSAIASSSSGYRVGQGQNGGRSSHHQEHGHREGVVASSGEDPLLCVGRGRDPRCDRRLEEKTGSCEAGCIHGGTVSPGARWHGMQRALERLGKGTTSVVPSWSIN